MQAAPSGHSAGAGLVHTTLLQQPGQHLAHPPPSCAICEAPAPVAVTQQSHMAGTLRCCQACTVNCLHAHADDVLNSCRQVPSEAGHHSAHHQHLLPLDRRPTLLYAHVACSDSYADRMGIPFRCVAHQLWRCLFFVKLPCTHKSLVARLAARAWSSIAVLAFF